MLMKNFWLFNNIFLLFVVFIVSLLISKTILAALFFVFVFKGAKLAVDLYLSIRNIPRFKKWLLLLTDVLTVLLLTFAVYNLFFFPAELLLIDIFFVVPKIPAIYSNLFFIVIFLLFLFFDWQKVKGRVFFKFLLVLEIVGAVVYLGCRKEKLAGEYLPKIYRVNISGGYQGEKLEISGVNFYPAFKRGKVILEKAGEVQILFWSENKVVGMIPVPARFGVVDLVVEREDGVISNVVKFEVKDPGKLKN